MNRRRTTWCWIVLNAAALPLAGCQIGDEGPDSPVASSAQPTGGRAGASLAAGFPGAGKGAAGLSLAVGTTTVTCEQPGPAPAGSTGPAPGQTATRECYFDADHPNDPAAIMEWVVEAATQGELVHARLTFNPRFVDNSYGANAIGWDGSAASAATPGPVTPGTGMPGTALPGAAMPGAAMPGAVLPAAPLPGAAMPGAPKPGEPMAGAAKPGMAGKPDGKPKPMKSGHTFKDLVGSDHAEFTLTDKNGAIKLKFKADYLSESAAAPSGYQSLGVSGGEGKMLVGAAGSVVAVSTSLDRNLNSCGYGGYTIDSPATDADYSENSSTPNWDYRVVYDVWVQRAAFGDVGFGRATVEFVHASPSKAGSNTIEVEPRECPPTWPPYCANPSGCGAEPPPSCAAVSDAGCPQEPPPCIGECPLEPERGTYL